MKCPVCGADAVSVYGTRLLTDAGGGLVRLIDHWGRMGADVRATAPECAQAPGMVTRWQLATIERLAWEMGWGDGLEDARLIAFLRRTARVERPQWLTRHDASSVISGLMRWKRQRAKKEAHA